MRKKPMRCKYCNKILASHNKSGLCSNCYMDNRDYDRQQIAKSKIFLLLGLMLTISLAVGLCSGSLGTFKQNECVNIKTILNSSYVNISSISYPNSTIILSNKVMTKSGYSFNLSFCDTSPLGTYIYDYFDDVGNVYVNDFTITYAGSSLDIQKSILYLGLIAILTLFFVFILFTIPKLPSGDNVNEDNLIISINRLKYFRPVLYSVCWGLLLAIIFLTANISLAYLPDAMFGNFFFMIYKIMFYATLPIFIIWFIFIFVKIAQDNEIKRLIERGVDIKSKP